MRCAMIQRETESTGGRKGGSEGGREKEARGEEGGEGGSEEGQRQQLLTQHLLARPAGGGFGSRCLKKTPINDNYYMIFAYFLEAATDSGSTVN